MHRDAVIYVAGTLHFNGTLDNPVSVMGDRLEHDYDEIPGQWYAIYFAPGSVNNTIEYANIINGTFGLWADSLVISDTPILTVSNTEINRMSYAGIRGRGTTIEASNTVIGDCGNNSIQLLWGGSYSFTHCTVYNNWYTGFSNRKTPALEIANYFAYEKDGNIIINARDMEKVQFRNCIISGTRSNELLILKSPDAILNYSFNSCLMKVDPEVYDYTGDPKFTGIINNENPVFDTIPGSYQLDSLSPAIDKGFLDYAVDFPLDKKGDYRTADGLPDLGAYERIKQ
jgi:hypothetical protein